eukprot:TRINITY_DN10306_c0_g1_i1.p1 TRINITY_DN10306_c0_g1~~TRINITY_DN10306_c0_g1_i1.p1  ORF type:complete len:124 (-),score=2.58 TRINITY_DN10306_c0_g1_i1:4-375(-)
MMKAVQHTIRGSMAAFHFDTKTSFAFTSLHVCSRLQSLQSFFGAVPGHRRNHVPTAQERRIGWVTFVHIDKTTVQIKGRGAQGGSVVTVAAVTIHWPQLICVIAEHAQHATKLFGHPSSFSRA